MPEIGFQRSSIIFPCAGLQVNRQAESGGCRRYKQGATSRE